METYEKLGRKQKGAVICNMALSSYLPSQDPGTRKKLSDEMDGLPPSQGKTSGASNTSKTPGLLDGVVALSEMRALYVPYHVNLQGNFASAEFLISITNGRKTVDAVFLSGAEELRGASAALAALKYPQSFPDETPARVVRKAIVSCSTYSKSCTLALMLPTDAAVPVPFQGQPDPAN